MMPFEISKCFPNLKFFEIVTNMIKNKKSKKLKFAFIKKIKYLQEKILTADEGTSLIFATTGWAKYFK